MAARTVWRRQLTLSIAGAALLASCSNSTLPQHTLAGPNTATGLGDTTASVADTSSEGGAVTSLPASASAGATPTPLQGSSGGSSSAPTQNVGSTVGVSKTEIKISVSAPFSGVYGPLMDKAFTNGFDVW